MLDLKPRHAFLPSPSVTSTDRDPSTRTLFGAATTHSRALTRGFVQLSAAAAIAVVTLASTAHADLPTPKLPTGKIAEVAAGLAPKGVADSQVVDGLRAMLRTGTSNAVAETSRTDGYLGNEEIRIELPPALATTVSRLEKMQMGSLVADLETSMNRAAEKAAAEAQPVFDEAIDQLGFSDAAGILAGGERAATDFFESETREALTAKLRPIVEKSMEDVGLAKVYDSFVKPLSAIPFFSAPKVDMADHVTSETLDGLFTVLAQEEAKMRKDPSARTVPLVQGLFGSN